VPRSKIRRWFPKETKEKEKEEIASTSSAEKRKSKIEIQKELAKLYAELEEVEDNEDLLFLPDNGDMENLQGITQVYLCGSPYI
jgi:(p)ppGpp synthase/HD superfamily hydrolase